VFVKRILVGFGKDPRHRIPPRPLGVAGGISGRRLLGLLKELVRQANKKDA
jgi:hypothetical protein